MFTDHLPHFVLRSTENGKILFYDVPASSIHDYKFSQPTALLGSNVIVVRNDVEISGLLIHIFENKEAAVLKIAELSNAQTNQKPDQPKEENKEFLCLVKKVDANSNMIKSISEKVSNISMKIRAIEKIVNDSDIFEKKVSSIFLLLFFVLHFTSFFLFFFVLFLYF